MTYELRITGDGPLELLSGLTALGMHGMQDSSVALAAKQIVDAETKKLAIPAQPQQGAPVEEPISDTPTEAPGPADGANGQTAAPGDKPEPVPTVEQVRAKGIEASRKYGKGAVVAILQKFGASGMSAIAEKDRAAFLTALEGLGEVNA